MFRIQNVIRGIEMFYLCIGLTSSGGICKFSDAYYGEHFVTKNLFAYLILKKFSIQFAFEIQIDWMELISVWNFLRSF